MAKSKPAPRQTRAAPTVDEDGYYVNEDGKYVDAEGNLVEEPVKAESRAEPAVDEDGYYVNEDGDYVDAEGNVVDQPVKAERAAPEVNEDGFYVDADGNFVDADGEPSEEPVKARDDDMDEGDTRSAPRGRAAPRGKAGRAAPAAGTRAAKPAFSQKQASELASIANQARAHGVELNLASAIDRGLSPAAFRKIAFDKLAEKSKMSQVRGAQHSGIEVRRDEREGRVDAMTLALTGRVLASRGSDGIDYAPRAKAEKKWVEKHSARAEQFAGMGFVEIAAECIGHRGNIRTARQAVDIIERAFQSTSDFPAIFQNVLNKSLLARYELAEPTYKRISIERQFNDFRPHPMIRAGEFRCCSRSPRPVRSRPATRPTAARTSR